MPADVRQIDGLQMLRALAVFEVLWVHTGQAVGVSIRSWNFSIFGVDLFFVISGFILSTVILRERESSGRLAARRFLKRRWLRIFPIYWIFCFIAWLRMVHMHHRPGREVIPGLFLLPSPRFNSTPVLLAFGWTLIFELFFYYVLVIALFATVRYAVPVALAALSVLSTAGLLLNIKRPVLIVLCNPIHLEFVIGCAVALLYARFGRRHGVGRVLTLCACMFAVTLAVLQLPDVATSGQMILDNTGVFARVGTWGLCAGLLVCGVVFWSPSLKTSRVGSIVLVLGSASYSTYLASPLLLEAFSRLLGTPGNVPSGATVAGAIRLALDQSIMLLGMLGLGWACYNFIEWPLLRRLQAFSKDT